MILIENTKFACSECIRGHRSTLCRHTMRPLLQVRSKGRPNLEFPYGNRNYRVAVYAEKVKEESPVPPGSDCKNTPVVILKTTEKQVMDITNGQILGPYNEDQNDKHYTPIIRPENFVNSTSCCTGRNSRVNKGCDCGKKKVSRSKILRSYLSKKMATKKGINCDTAGSMSSHVSCSSKSDLSLSEHTSHGSETDEDSSISLLGKPKKSSCCGKSALSNVSNSHMPNRVDEVAKVLPIIRPEGSKAQPLGPDLTRRFNGSQSFSGYGTNGAPNKIPPNDYMLPLNSIVQTPSQAGLGTNAIQVNNQNVFQVISVPPCSIPGSCGCSSDCSCPSCVVHNNLPIIKTEDSHAAFNNDQQYGSNLVFKPEAQGYSADRIGRELPRDFGPYTNYLAQFTGFESLPPPFLSELQTELQAVEQAGIDQQNDNQPDSGSCTCADDQCFCTNCETHGIIDGYKLDDIFGTQASTYNSFPYG